MAFESGGMSKGGLGGGFLVCLLVSSPQQLCQVSILHQFFHFYFLIFSDYLSLGRFSTKTSLINPYKKKCYAKRSPELKITGATRLKSFIFSNFENSEEKAISFVVEFESIKQGSRF